MQRNRESAHQSRQRKKMQVEELTRRCDGLQQQNTYLSGMSCLMPRVCRQAAHVTRHHLLLWQRQPSMLDAERTR